MARSPRDRSTAAWLCLECDPNLAQDQARLEEAYARQAAAPAGLCQACSSNGCPHCSPQRFGLAARKGQALPRLQPPSLDDLIKRFGGYAKITPEGWEQFDYDVRLHIERYLNAITEVRIGQTTEK